MDDRRGTDPTVHHPGIGLAGRLMFTLIFFLSGVTHFTDVEGYAALMPAAIPGRPFWVLVSGAVELAGALLVATNRAPRLGAWMIVLFLVPVTVVVHGVAMLGAPDDVTRRIQLSFFLKGVSMTGAALLITQLGVVAPRGAAAEPSAAARETAVPMR